MNILHISLASSFTYGLNYQDNILSNINRADGNNVMVISNCSKFINGVLVDTDEENITLSNGIKLLRLKYDYIHSKFVSSKIRSVSRLMEVLQCFSPDIILHHGLASYELMNVALYKKQHPHIRFYADSHADYHNSATNLLSKYILHKVIYKYFLYKALPYIDKIFYVGYEAMPFIKELYNIPDEKLEYYPLGGVIPDPGTRANNNIVFRKTNNIPINDIIIMHSGKMDQKKRTLDVVSAFHNVYEPHLHLILIGTMTDDVKEEVMPIINSDIRILYLGWESGDELLSSLCACDLYVQPGSQSATMQNALCCGAAAALYPHKSHTYLLGDSVFYIQTIYDMIDLFQKVSNDKRILEDKRRQSFEIAQKRLDYKVLAARLYR